MKFVQMCKPQLKDDGAFAGNTYVDTSGFAHLRVLIAAGDTDVAVGSTTAAAALKLEASDVVDSGYADIDNAALSDVIAADDDGKLFAIDIDLSKAHGLYIRVNAPTAADGTTGANLCIIGILSEPTSGYLPDGSEFEELIKA